ncbi:type II restriction endonuclease [Clostridium grantii]|uniref:Type-2 restriction enzyme n=1 Tax=Clostridium grantii DSM 8605 TaxID=1121316 RepID=A0A1M5VHV5_9CLOT|nr:type II restriction endonuclease [Clostridium grantii]SHH74493.1 type II restriction enzyme [Clostridium grantii DSM 8605]
MDEGIVKFEYDNKTETFEYLMDTLKDTIKGWDYFVNWTKANKNVTKLEVSLNILNYLIGKENIEEEFKILLKQYPEIMQAIPVLVASREENFKILQPNTGEEIRFDVDEYSFSKSSKLSEDEIDKAIEFTKKTGVLEIIKNKKVKNLVDYVLGVEVGLDSNGRKNRSGTAMEDLVELFIKKICIENDYEYINQATPSRIKEKWGREVKVDKASRRFDFAINTKDNLFLVETNYYGGGGSKLKSTAGEYKTLYDLITSDGYEFVWITDGKGWFTAKKPLQETFEHIKYLLNLDMMQQGVLEEILENRINF